jgi:Uma2 family endonuclease
MNADGEIEIVPPAGWESSHDEAGLITQLRNWADADKRGKVLSSSAGFTLPNGAVRAPDASWIELSRWNSVTKKQRKKFGPLCPNFVVEIKSPSDRMPKLHAKMREYMENGAKLGWLIDSEKRAVYIYRPGQEPERLINPARVKGEGPVKGFVLDTSDLWD